jgi:hypothetical protein
MANRFTNRYSDQLKGRQCETPSCSGTARTMSPRCHACAGRLRRFGHPLQTLPALSEMDRSVRRLEEARGRLKALDLEAIEARWNMLIEDCRAKATPSFKDKGTLTYSSYEREAAQLLRDISEAIPFARVLDLLGAIHLLQMERTFFKSDEAMACSTVELVRRTSRIGCQIMAQNNTNGTIQKSWRREMCRDSRMACATMLNVALGGAAQALAKRAASQESEAKKVRDSY